MEEGMRRVEEVVEQRGVLREELEKLRGDLARYVDVLDRCPKPLSNLFETVNALIGVLNRDSEEYRNHLGQLFTDYPKSLKKELQQEHILKSKFIRQLRAFQRILPQIPSMLEAQTRKREKYLAYLHQQIDDLSKQTEYYKKELGITEMNE